MLKYIPANAQHIGARREQQDSFAFSDPADKTFVAHGGLLGIIADGMGGLEGGRQASGAAVAAFLAAYSRKTIAEQIPAALTRSLSEANAAVKAVAQQMGTEESTGTTLVAGVIHNTSLYWISAGDSRMYVLRQGHLARVNADHTYGADLWPEVAAGRMDRQQAQADPQAPHLTSYLGLPEVPSYDVSLRPFPLEPDDIFLACTDGVYRTIGEEEMAGAFQSAPPSAACDAIKAATLAKNNPGQDNLTVIAIQLRDTSNSVRLAAPWAEAAAAPPPKGHGAAMVTVFGLEVLLAAGIGLYLIHPWTNKIDVKAHTKAADPAKGSTVTSDHGKDGRPIPPPGTGGKGSTVTAQPAGRNPVNPGSNGQRPTGDAHGRTQPSGAPGGTSAGGIPPLMPLDGSKSTAPGNSPNVAPPPAQTTTPQPGQTQPQPQGSAAPQAEGSGTEPPSPKTSPTTAPQGSTAGGNSAAPAPATTSKPPQSHNTQHKVSSAKSSQKKETKPAISKQPPKPQDQPAHPDQDDD